MQIKKPTDDKLRKQIKIDKALFLVFIFMALISTTIYVITSYLGWLAIMLLYTIFALQCNNDEYFNKIRLEIRGLKS